MEVVFQLMLGAFRVMVFVLVRAVSPERNVADVVESVSFLEVVFGDLVVVNVVVVFDVCEVVSGASPEIFFPQMDDDHVSLVMASFLVASDLVSGGVPLNDDDE